MNVCAHFVLIGRIPFLANSILQITLGRIYSPSSWLPMAPFLQFRRHFSTTTLRNILHVFIHSYTHLAVNITKVTMSCPFSQYCRLSLKFFFIQWNAVLASTPSELLVKNCQADRFSLVVADDEGRWAWLGVAISYPNPVPAIQGRLVPLCTRFQYTYRERFEYERGRVNTESRWGIATLNCDVSQSPLLGPPSPGIRAGKGRATIPTNLLSNTLNETGKKLRNFLEERMAKSEKLLFLRKNNFKCP